MAEAREEDGVRIIDPNPRGENVAHEDLMVYVKLKAITKTRSIIEGDSNEKVAILETELSNVKGETNYTYPQGTSNLTTNWTDIGGGALEGGTNLGTFGISSIDIDIKSSFIPQIQVNFIDIRGATLFEQGPCSPYASFFHMPYPVFELTVKGFYGKAVTYTLALRKFNTKFNPSTGNFEVKAEFIGYTYAFLADLVMGYALAAPYMVGGEDKLKGIWSSLDRSPENPLPTNPITLKQMLDDINKLETVLGELSNSEEFQDVSNLNALKAQLDNLNQTLGEFEKELDGLGVAFTKEDSKYPQGGKSYLKILLTSADTKQVTAIRKLVITYFGNNNGKIGIYESQINELNGFDAVKNYEIPQIKPIKSTIKQAGLYVTNTSPALTVTGTNADENYYYIDLGESFLKPNSKFNISVDEELVKLQDILTNLVNEAVSKVLGYVPTVKNIMTILLANMELFLQLLVQSSIKAEQVHDNIDEAILGVDGNGKPNSTKIYPWPKYSQSDASNKTGVANTQVETYPGENSTLRYWEEVRFVEDFLTAYLELKEDLDLITGDVGGKRGFDNFIPLNVMESRLMDTFGGPYPNAYYKDKQRLTVIRNIGERAFLVGDHTSMNGLTAWKSRFSLPWTSVGGASDTPVALSTLVTSSTSSSRKKVNGWIRLMDSDLMFKWGRVDGINAVNTIDTSKLLTIIKTQLDSEELRNEFKNEIINNLKETGLKVYDSLNDWATTDNNGLGIPSTTIKTVLNNIQDPELGNDYYDGKIYTYPSVTIGDTNNSTEMKPNPHDFKTFHILPDDNIGTTQLNGLISTEATANSSPFGKDGYAGRINTNDMKEVLVSDYENNANGVFNLDRQARVCTVPGDDNTYKWHFIKLYDWDNATTAEAGTYSVCGIDKISGGDTVPIAWGEVWSPNGNYTENTFTVHSALVQSPLWGKNLLTSQNFKSYDYDTDEVGGYWTTDISGQHTDRDQSIKTLSYLTLISMGWADVAENDDYNEGEGYANWNDTGDAGDTIAGYSNASFFKITSSQVRAPKHFTLLTGAILWRLRESGEFSQLNTPLVSTETSGSESNNDPLQWWTGAANVNMTKVGGNDNGTTKTRAATNLTGMKHFKPYHHPHITSKKIGTIVTNPLRNNGAGPTGQVSTFALIPNSQPEEYMDIKNHMKALYLLPNDVKETFIKNFENWSLGVFSKSYLPRIDPLNFGGGSFESSYATGTQDDNRMAIRNGTTDNDNEDIHNMFNELYNSYDVIGYSTPKAFYGITENDFSSTFNMTEREFYSFMDGWIDGYKEAVDTRLKDIASGDDSNDIAGKNATNDNDIKLNLYKSFKSIFDKWVSRSSDGGGGDYKLFYNRVENNPIKTKRLIDHFNFVDRGFNNIGDKAVVDITFLKSLAEDPTASLYQIVSGLLSKNNFDFHPLPSFIKYEDSNLKELEKMFEPVTNLEGIDSSPSFVCMYVGGTSTNLDIGASSTFCGNNETVYEYENDGIKLDDVQKRPKDIDSSKVTAFLVEYGIENQSHFKSIALDQAEFKETQESLMVIDQLAKGGDENNRSSKGQNLYNVYQTRSYTCTVESMGNMQIQPFMYFQLTNVPMFWGAYLITEVKHNIQPNNVTTTFKGTRVPKIVIPLVTDAYSTMVLGQTDPKKGGTTGREVIDSIKGKNNSGSGYDVNETYGEEITIGEFDDVPFAEDTTDIECPEGTKSQIAEGWTKGVKSKIRLCTGIPGVSGGVSSQIAQNVMDMFAKAKADGIELTAGGWRSMDSQIAAGATNGCPKNWKSSSQCDVATAPPGFSNHQSGNALDIGTKASGGKTICWGLKGTKKGQYSKSCLGVPTGGRKGRKDEDKAFRWLIANASTYKLINYWKEPWHWSINGG
jgi:hypothetical protein